MHLVCAVSFVILLAACVNAQTPVKIYAVKFNGYEVIDFSNTAKDLAYAANLQWDPKTTEQFPRLYFTADRGSPNLFYAQIDPKGGNHSFWSTGKSPYSDAATGYFTFAVSNTTILGPAYPSSITQGTVPSFVLQSTYVDSQGNATVSSNAPTYQGYTFITAIIDPVIKTGGLQYVYIVAWGPQDMVVMRGTFIAGTDPVVSVDPVSDVRPVGSQPLCFEQYSPTSLPKLWLTDTNLYLAVPGRCAAFFKFTLPPGPWGSADVSFIDPTDVNVKYMSSAVMDATAGIIFYTIKTYNAGGTTINYIDIKNFSKVGIPVDLGIAEGEGVLEVGYVNGTRYLFVAASGGDVVQQWQVDNNLVLSNLRTATLDDGVNAVSSLLYVENFVYMTTYEPNAKIVRISLKNFCLGGCMDNGFCDGGVCKCEFGYSIDTTQAGAPCVPTRLVQSETVIRENQAAAGALGFLFAASLIMAIIGWVLFIRSRKIASYERVSGDL